MLYVSTRNHVDSFTAYRVLRENRASDGGVFVPMRFPVFSQEELHRLKSSSFGEIVSYILNKFFSSNISAWDIETCAGRQPFKLVPMNHKIIISELWHNQNSEYRYLESRIYSKLCSNHNVKTEPDGWAKIIIRAAVICGMWSKALATESEVVDVAVPAEDFFDPIAFFYAKKLGLSVGKIICVCKNNDVLWDFLRKGTLNTTASAVPDCLENLLYDRLGRETVCAFGNALEHKKLFQVNEEQLSSLRKDFYVAVIGGDRTGTLAGNIYRSCGYIPDHGVALCFGGLQDYRVESGTTQKTLLIGDSSPALLAAEVCGLLHISQDELFRKVKNS